MFRPLVGLALAACLSVAPVNAAETSVAVAANFAEAAEAIASAFEAHTGDHVTLSFGATGALYTQITQAAPFGVFLSADNTRPAKAAADGFGVAGSAFTYAIGRLVLYSPSFDATDGAATLLGGAFRHIAIADPKTAPYGAAAMEVIDALGLTEAVAPKLVTGESVTQALLFVDSRNAELGFVALSQVIDRPDHEVWRIPADLHTPILQDAVLLKTGATDPVATAFLDFLRSDAARAIIEKYGYDVVPR